ncbi:hypothetical protein O181_090269 [Austropuccinia psidii MF-1]|uniref:Retrotransposon gag domain-containing protein n=1 Tax=Austropuccinia psidii MF-1 TaxID=1389203 RepID=A0A9Q3IV99_9BASI|nr:hypothetical protein [Austropuccinia psidii MF-1]
MQQMTQIMANLQAASFSEASRPPAFKTPSMKAPEFFVGTQPFKVRSFIQSCQLVSPNDPANFSQDRKKVLCSTSFLIGRAAKWIEPYLSNLTNQDTLRKAEAELDSLRMREGGHVSLYLANFRILVSRIGDWGVRALINPFRKGLPSRILDQLASHPSRIDSLQDLMDISPDLDTSYHERQNEKIHHQEKKPEASKSNFSSSSQKKKYF